VWGENATLKRNDVGKNNPEEKNGVEIGSNRGGRRPKIKRLRTGIEIGKCVKPLKFKKRSLSFTGNQDKTSLPGQSQKFFAD